MYNPSLSQSYDFRSYPTEETPKQSLKSYITTEITHSKIRATEKSTSTIGTTGYHQKNVLTNVQPNRLKVISKLRSQYNQNYPGLNIARNMKPQLREEQENQEQIMIENENEIMKAIDNFREFRLRKANRRRKYSSVTRKSEPEKAKGTGPTVETRTTHQTSLSTISPSTPPISKGRAAFLTEQMEQDEIIDDRKSIDPPAFQLRLEKTPYQHMGSSFRTIDRSADIFSEMSRVSYNFGLARSFKVPKEYLTDESTKFHYLYKKFKDPAFRDKMISKRKGTYDGFHNTSMLGPFIKNNLEVIQESSQSLRPKKFERPGSRGSVLDYGGTRSRGVSLIKKSMVLHDDEETRSRSVSLNKKSALKNNESYFDTRNREISLIKRNMTMDEGDIEETRSRAVSFKRTITLHETEEDPPKKDSSSVIRVKTASGVSEGRNKGKMKSVSMSREYGKNLEKKKKNEVKVNPVTSGFQAMLRSLLENSKFEKHVW